MTRFLDHLAEHVVLADGAMGSRVQAMSLTLEDYQGHENCTEILNASRPDVVREIHRGYYEAGADAVTSNSFGGSPVTLGEFGLEGEAFALNKRAGELAREAAEMFTDGRQRFVFGSIGPGTKLPSLGHITYEQLEDAFAAQAAGLLAGGIDAFLIETCQDPLQIKAAVNGAKRARAEAGTEIPIMVDVTVETTGTLLVGADIAAAATVVHALDVPVIGLNCATGPQEMAEHVKWLSENWDRSLCCMPNAGLPELVDGQTRYPLSPAELARWQERFLEEDGVNIIGGCCGTVIEHIAALDELLRRRAGNRLRPAPKPRSFHWVPSIASLYSQVPLRQENAYLSIGERCNANGSRKFRELQEQEDWDGCVDMAREQVREGAMALDVCTAFVGRDEVKDMTAVIDRFRGAATAPLVIDSTELPVIEAALKLYGGKPIINSINFEDGETPAAQRLELARKFGAAVVALTIDEEGMAKEAGHKLEIARRLYDFACGTHGLPASDLLFDPLTFTICTGNEDDRKLGLWTLEAIEKIRAELPECQIVLGLSNISFGLNPAARHVLNSVFLEHALKRGMTGAIVHFSRLLPLHQIPEEEVRVAEDLIFDRRSKGYDPLHAFVDLFSGREKEARAERPKPATVEEALKQRIIDGDRKGLDEDLKTALKSHSPLDIINVFLLDGMKVVGELFGAGKMQLPFVLQSAETMKAAVAFLEPYMERTEGQEKGVIVLATVRGDVHDIGKNLVDIILTNNGYKVINLGIKQPIANILSAAREHHADAIGMSGLLVKSTVIMRENLEELSREKVDLPVFLGGAALTRGYVEKECVASYAGGRVAYARDAFDGLSLMDRVVEGKFDDYLLGHQKKTAAAPAAVANDRGAPAAGMLENAPPAAEEESGDAAALPSGSAGSADRPGTPPSGRRPIEQAPSRARRGEIRHPETPPVPPFWGAKLLEGVRLKALVPYLNETTLFQFQWGYRKQGRSVGEFRKWAARELTPIMMRLVAQAEQEGILVPKAAYGYWKCAGDGNDLVLFEPDGEREAGRFSLPRQNKPGGLCIADFVRPIDDPVRDVMGLQVVTVGERASEVARQWFAENRYQDYLYLHGLGVEMAEAMAEYVHKRIRAELGFAGEDAREMNRLLKQEYRGSRYSFGYPACPNLGDQRLVLDLLGAERIGIVLGEEDQLEPEQSTSAIVILHPKAKYFVA